MRSWILATAAILLVLSISANAIASAEPLRVGDPAPGINVSGWLQEAPDWSESALQRHTVVAFWATWCPLSRLVLTRMDSLLAQPSHRDVRILAFTLEREPMVRAFLDTSGWDNLGIACDEDQKAAQDWLDATAGPESQSFPYAFIIRNGVPGVGDQVLWMGPMADFYADEPLEAFEFALWQAVTGEFDLAAEMRRADEVERSRSLFPEIFAALDDMDLDRLEPLLEEVTRIEIATEWKSTLVNNMNNVAWKLVTYEGCSDRHRELAMRAAQIALENRGRDNAGFMDTYARVLHDTGRLREALAAQERAVELARGTRHLPELLEALGRYREELGLPVDESGVLESGAPAEMGIWHGTLNEAASKRTRAGGCLLVRPSTFADSTREAEWSRAIDALHERFYTGSLVKTPEQVASEDLAESMLVLYGTRESNSLSDRILS